VSTPSQSISGLAVVVVLRASYFVAHLHRLSVFTTTMAPTTYIISRVTDPIFAVVIGLSAATLRIKREEKEKGKTSQETIESFKRYSHTGDSSSKYLLILMLHYSRLRYTAGITN
jgi:hypothetical protein